MSNEFVETQEDIKGEKKLFVTWERFKPTEEDSYETGLCKTVAFLLRHVMTGTGNKWVDFDQVIKKAEGLWPEGIKPTVNLAKAYKQCHSHDEEEARPRFEFQMSTGRRQIRALHQSERVTKAAKRGNYSEEPLKVFQGKDLIGYVDPTTMRGNGRIWNSEVAAH